MQSLAFYGNVQVYERFEGKGKIWIDRAKDEMWPQKGATRSR